MLNSFWGFMFFMGMLSGIWISIHSNSWFGVWAGLELNLICFIPFIIQGDTVCSEPSVKYFLVQACASFLLFFSGVSMMNYMGMMKSLITVSLLLKLGAAPFYFWYLWVGSSLKWLQFLSLSTIQKISPLVLLFFSGLNKGSEVMIYSSIIVGGVVGGIGGINEASLRKLLIYSSLNHMSWMMMPLVVENELWLVYFFFYCLMLMMVVWILYLLKLYYLNQMFSVSISWVAKLTLLVSFLSLGGLPPLLGFFPKFMVIEMSSGSLMLFSLFFLIMSSVVTLFYYLRASLSVLMLDYSKIKFNFTFSEKFSMILVMIMTMIGGIMSVLFFQSFLQ
uniref:NADH-ubiquinone oxidoreductase chain 2 n=1 Tax=Armadillidium vulgare TaxID=13347 RepID=A0A221SE54_ARMVU|nr:NADH dehydrogenase subunit 2 [Armadillidium vulgare]